MFHPPTVEAASFSDDEDIVEIIQRPSSPPLAATTQTRRSRTNIAPSTGRRISSSTLRAPPPARRVVVIQDNDDDDDADEESISFKQLQKWFSHHDDEVAIIDGKLYSMKTTLKDDLVELLVDRNIEHGLTGTKPALFAKLKRFHQGKLFWNISMF